MRIILIIVLLFVCNVCEGTVLNRYYDKVSSDEMGVAYSGRDGTPCVTNPDWNVEVISENQKQHYINLKKAQLDAKVVARQALINKEKATARAKLEALGLTSSEIDMLIK